MTQTLNSYFVQPDPILPPFSHQTTTANFIVDNRRVYIGNDAGTGKTRSCLDAFEILRDRDEARKMLVLAPKAILEAAWVADAAKFTPGLRVVPAYARNRSAAFEADADVYVTNHDAAAWLSKHPDAIADCDMIVIDEATAYKNRAAVRSRAVRSLMEQFSTVVLMCGTPMPNGLEDIWHQILLIDGGERLGPNYFKFRSAAYTPTNQGPFIKWEEKPGAREVVADLISDIFLRFTLEECIDMPDRVFNSVEYTLPAALRTQYDVMVKNAILQLSEDGQVKAINEAVLRQKLLQIASGAVYESPDKFHVLDTGRYELVAQLASMREHTLLPYIWKHQHHELVKALDSLGVTHITIQSGAREGEIHKVVDRFQAGEFQVLLAHPKSASHGLTLTRATATIWSSPTMELDRFIQFNARNYRAGQEKRCEVLMVSGKGTVDEAEYRRLQGKDANQQDLLSLLRELQGV